MSRCDTCSKNLDQMEVQYIQTDNGDFCLICAGREIDRLHKLEDTQRWRKWPEEKPEKDGDYLCADSGRIFVAGFADGFWAEDYGTDELLAKVQYWRPIGPLPGEGGE